MKGQSMFRKQSTPLEASYVFALWAIALLVVMSTGVAFVESYDGLLKWSQGHGLDGWRADIWPLQVDAFIAIGESCLFIAVLREWDKQGRIFSWIVTVIGAVVSVAANVGHVGATSLTDQATAALPPLAACGGLTIGLQILKRVIRTEEHARASNAVTPPVAGPAPVTWKIVNGKIGWTVDLAKDTAHRPVRKIGSAPVPELPTPAVQPVPDPEVPERAPEQIPDKAKEPPSGTLSYPTRHRMWGRGVEMYRESIKNGKKLSQRELAAKLGQRNRSLSSAIIRYVNEVNSNGAGHDTIPPATETG